MAEFESCDKCKHNMKMPNEEPCCGCIHAAVDKFAPKSNADRIRAMTDEELAEFFDSGLRSVCLDFHCEECNNALNCDVCYLEWLKSEVKE